MKYRKALSNEINCAKCRRKYYDPIVKKTHCNLREKPVNSNYTCDLAESIAGYDRRCRIEAEREQRDGRS